MFQTCNYKHNGTAHLLDIGLYLDIMVMSYVAYYNDKNVLITHPLYTILNYLKKGFLLDVITVFPFEYIVSIYWKYLHIQ